MVLFLLSFLTLSLLLQANPSTVVIATRQFIESMIVYVAVKGKPGEDDQKETFLARAQRYQACLSAVREIAGSVDSSLAAQTPKPTQEEEITFLPPPTRLRPAQQDAELNALQRDLADLSSLPVPIKSPRATSSHALPTKKTESQGVTDKLFDYLGEILDHNVLGDKALQEAADSLQAEDIPDIDLDDI